MTVQTKNGYSACSADHHKRQHHHSQAEHSCSAPDECLMCWPMAHTRAAAQQLFADDCCALSAALLALVQCDAKPCSSYSSTAIKGTGMHVNNATVDSTVNQTMYSTLSHTSVRVWPCCWLGPAACCRSHQVATGPAVPEGSDHRAWSRVRGTAGSLLGSPQASQFRSATCVRQARLPSDAVCTVINLCEVRAWP